MSSPSYPIHTAATSDAAPTPLPALCELAHDIRKLIGVARASIIEVGQKLLTAKALVSHGEWLPWLDHEFGWSEQTARRYMQVAAAFKSLTVSDFDGLTIAASAFYVLASPKVPEDVRSKAVETAKAGTNVTRKVALRLIEAAAPVPVEDNDTDVIDATDDDDDDDDGDYAFPDRPPVPNDPHWQEAVRDWIADRRAELILLKDVFDRFADTIPLHRASRRWFFDFEELGSYHEMSRYALLASLRSLDVTFRPPLRRGRYPAPETKFAVTPRRRSRW